MLRVSTSVSYVSLLWLCIAFAGCEAHTRDNDLLLRATQFQTDPPLKSEGIYSLSVLLVEPVDIADGFTEHLSFTDALGVNTEQEVKDYYDDLLFGDSRLSVRRKIDLMSGGSVTMRAAEPLTPTHGIIRIAANDPLLCNQDMYARLFQENGIHLSQLDIPLVIVPNSHHKDPCDNAAGYTTRGTNALLVRDVHTATPKIAFASTFFHELGHLLYLDHAQADGDEYGDLHDVMGRSFDTNSYSLVNLWKIGWLDDTEVYHAPQAVRYGDQLQVRMKKLGPGNDKNLPRLVRLPLWGDWSLFLSPSYSNTRWLSIRKSRNELIPFDDAAYVKHDNRTELLALMHEQEKTTLHAGGQSFSISFDSQDSESITISIVRSK